MAGTVYYCVEDAQRFTDRETAIQHADENDHHIIDAYYGGTL